MSRRLTMRPEAITEAQETYQWYEDRSPGAGDRFYEEFCRCLNVILEQPELPRVVLRTLRKRMIEHFPISVYYRVTDDEVRVFSVFHGARHPRRLGRLAE